MCSTATARSRSANTTRRPCRATLPVIGWGPWSGAGTVSWIAAHAADVLFTTTYFGSTILELLDDTQYLDGAVF
jgi:hypothetical protein